MTSLIGPVREWMRRRRAASDRERVRVERDREAPAEPPAPRGRTMAGKYVLLHKYLENRYAQTVVLTFAEIEDLLGFALPQQARLQADWWSRGDGTAAQPHHSDSWVLASRTAVPNLPARIVTFERAS